MNDKSSGLRLRPIMATLLLLIVGSFVVPGSPLKAAAEKAIKPVAELWQLAPPPPKVKESDRIAELRARRQAVINRMGNDSMMLLFSAEPRVYTNDVDYHYRQENNLYYLTGIKQADVVLVLIPGANGANGANGASNEILFMPERNPLFETWNGRMMSFDEARARSGIQDVRHIQLLKPLLAFIAPGAEQAMATRGPIPQATEQLKEQWKKEFHELIQAVAADRADLYLLTPNGLDLREYRQEHEFAGRISSSKAGFKIKNAHPIFAELRLRKSESELKLMQHAVDITSEAFHRVFAAVAPAMYEYEIQAEFEYTFRRRNADNWGYPCIVGAGRNATTLHYNTSQERLDDGSLLLMDCAAEYDHYTADITRTLPINGKFTKEQAEIYSIVYEAQAASIKAVRPGNSVNTRHDSNVSPLSVHGRSVEAIKQGLLRLGLITSTSNNEYRNWFMHGTSHWLGMNVHDVGDYTKPLAPGMVLTVEPGIYIRPDALEVLAKNPENERFIKAIRPAFEKYKGIGVRIEDDVLVTEGEPNVMSRAIPSRLEDVEAAMARLKQELRKSGWPVAMK